MNRIECKFHLNNKVIKYSQRFNLCRLMFTFALIFKTVAFTAVILEFFSFRNSLEFEKRSFEWSLSSTFKGKNALQYKRSTYNEFKDQCSFLRNFFFILLLYVYLFRNLFSTSMRSRKWIKRTISIASLNFHFSLMQ